MEIIKRTVTTVTEVVDKVVSCDGYKHLYRLDDFRAKLNKVIDSLEEF